MCDFDEHPSRRRFFGVAALATGVLATGIPKAVADDRNTGVRETADLITGPFYPQLKPRDRDSDMTLLRGHRQRSAGQIVQLSGRVTNLRGKPVSNARIELWQANMHGRYAHPSDPNIQLPLDPDFQGFALLRTGKDGSYRVTTVKPGPYPTARGDMRAPHIHFDIEGHVDRKVTQLFFPDEHWNDQDRHLNSTRRPETLIAEVLPSAVGSVLAARWDIVLTRG